MYCPDLINTANYDSVRGVTNRVLNTVYSTTNISNKSIQTSDNTSNEIDINSINHFFL